MTSPRAAADVEALCVDMKQAARLIGVSVWTLRNYIDEGLLPTVKFPGRFPGETSRRVLLSVDDLKTFVSNHRRGGKA